eukprot:760476-Hanusia_phi.AAC.5
MALSLQETWSKPGGGGESKIMKQYNHLSSISVSQFHCKCNKSSYIYHSETDFDRPFFSPCQYSCDIRSYLLFEVPLMKGLKRLVVHKVWQSPHTATKDSGALPGEARMEARGGAGQGEALSSLQRRYLNRRNGRRRGCL